jgi:hypothetical protein
MAAPFASPEVEDALIPLSALQHQLFCPRQCALIHVEGLWAEDGATAEGRILHERVDAGRPERRPGVRIVRGLALRSLALGVSGIADVVEFSGRPLRPFPVEYKRGKPKAHRADEGPALRPGDLPGGDVWRRGRRRGAVLRHDSAAPPGRLRRRPAHADRRNRSRGAGEHRRPPHAAAGAHARLPPLFAGSPLPAEPAGKAAARRPLAGGADRRLRGDRCAAC